MWYELNFRTPGDAKTLRADVHVPVASPWFSGHFPGNPVLPGIAQLGMVFDVIRHAFGEPLRVTEVTRVRFKQMILPGDCLTVAVEPRSAHDGCYAFRITKRNELVCSGAMMVEASDSAQR